MRAVQMGILRGLLGISRMDNVPNTQISVLCGVAKGMDERIDQSVLRWFGHTERVINDTIAKRIYVEDCV